MHRFINSLGCETDIWVCVVFDFNIPSQSLQRPKEKQWVMDKLVTALVGFLPICSEMMEPLLLQLGGNWTFLRASPHSQLQRHTSILYVGRMLWLLGINIVVGEVCFQSFGLFITFLAFKSLKFFMKQVLLLSILSTNEM